jgi:hypothetical protein
MSSDYVDYYHRVKEFGKKMKWDEKKVNAMLGDRLGFEREWKMHLQKIERHSRAGYDPVEN